MAAMLSCFQPKPLSSLAKMAEKVSAFSTNRGRIWSASEANLPLVLPKKESREADFVAPRPQSRKGEVERERGRKKVIHAEGAEDAEDAEAK
jgi:hypothetical protein